MNIIVSSYLFINAWTDFKRKEINMMYTIIFVAVGILYKYMVKENHYWSGVIPGLVLFLVSLVWRKHIGMGDGIIVMVFGWMCGFALVCDVLLGGFILAAVVGIVCYFWYRKTDLELPFVPFFLGSYLLQLWM